VADELVQELGAESSTGERFDHKNIRRRVYDALNVLMAIDVITKDKKEIKWLGLPNDLASDLGILEAEKAATEKRIADKKKSLTELIRRLISLKSLINRNKRQESKTTTSHGLIENPVSERLPLPFILINAPKDCRVHCEMLEDRTQYFFQFDSPFFINEDVEILRLMGLDSTSPEDLALWMPMDLLAMWSGGKVPILEGNSRIAVKTMPRGNYHPQSSPTGKRYRSNATPSTSGMFFSNTNFNFLNPPVTRVPHSNNASCGTLGDTFSTTGSNINTNSNLGFMHEFMSDLGFTPTSTRTFTNVSSNLNPRSKGNNNLGSSPII
jgi:hypothetical protein